MPTLDEGVWRKMEPGTGRPIKRLEAMRKLADAGVPVGVMVAPIIPGLTDDRAHIEEVISAARDHGAGFVTPNILNLKPGTKEWFMPALREAYPHLEPRYQKYYKGSYAPKTYTEEVLAVVSDVRAKYGFDRERRHDVEPTAIRAGQLQMSL